MPRNDVRECDLVDLLLDEIFLQLALLGHLFAEAEELLSALRILLLALVRREELRDLSH